MKEYIEKNIGPLAVGACAVLLLWILTTFTENVIVKVVMVLSKDY